MKKMRYFVSIALMVLLSFMLLACGNKDNAVEEKTSEITQVEEKTSSVEDNTEEEDEVYELNVNSPFWLMSLYRSEAEGEEEIWNVCAYASPLFFPAEKRTKIVFRGTLNQMIGVIQRIQRLNKAYNQEVLTPDDEENSEEHNNNLNY